MRIERLHRRLIRGSAPEADETVRTDENNAALRQSRPGRIEPRLPAVDDRDETPQRPRKSSSRGASPNTTR